MTLKTQFGAAAANSLDLTAVIAGLVDGPYYVALNADVDELGVDPAQHFMQSGRFENRSPHPLFDVQYYLGQLRGTVVDDPVAHYLREGWKQGRSPHPLFDPAYYAAQVGEELNESPLTHYLSQGWRQGHSPHPLFDPDYFVTTAAVELGGRDPLSHYLVQEEYNFAPHYLFSDAVYVAELNAKLGPKATDSYRGGPPLLHYVLTGHRHETKTHPLFDAGYYRRKATEALGRLADPAEDARLAAAQALRHYVEVGVGLGLSPSPFFDRDYYAAQVARPVDRDPLRHYLTPEGYRQYAPHPGLDLEYYSRRAGFLPSDVPSILHLLSTPQDERLSPHPAFDAARYKRIYEDVGRSGTCPILHFLESGMAEDRSPNQWFSPEYVYQSYPDRDFRSESATHHYFAGAMSRRTRLVFVSHDASLTGAPGTVLRLTQDFAQYDNVECFAIVARHGPRIADFQKTAHTVVLNGPFYSASSDSLREAVRELLSVTDGNPPVAAVVNSAESRAIIPELVRAGIPVITLVHEAADLYPRGAFDGLIQSSSRVVFGSNYVLERAHNVTTLPEGLAIVRGQGLQQDYVGTMNREAARRMVLEELDLDDDSFLVLGCGSVDYRKGADLFVAAALEYLAKKQSSDTRACFVWVGQGDGSILQSFINNAILGQEREMDIRFIGPRSDVEPYFMAADAFLMTSRVDPFPCVCQEAMAAGLPIIAFAEGGGTIEMIGDQAGFCVPLGDTSAMSSRLVELADDPQLRSRLGNRGRAIVREKWKPADYTSFLAAELANAAGIDVGRFGASSDAAGAKAPRAYFLFENWVQSPFLAHVETVVRSLNERGVNAEILLTRGRFAPGERGDALPAAPYRFLHPAAVGFISGRWRTSAEEVWHELQKFARASQPCVFFVADDTLATTLAPVLPSSVAVVPLIWESDAVNVESLYRLGPQLDAIVAATSAAQRELTRLNPGLSEKVSLIPPAVTKRVGTPEGARGIVLVHADVAQSQLGPSILGLKRILKSKGLPYRVVLTGEQMPQGRARRSLATSLGLSADDLFSGDAAEHERLIDSSAFVVLLSSDRSAIALLAQARSSGARVVAANPTPGLAELLRDEPHATTVRSGIRGAAEVIAGHANGATESTGTGAASRSARSSIDEADAYLQLIERLVSGLEAEGSGRAITLPHLAMDHMVWPAAVRRVTLQEINLPPT